MTFATLALGEGQRPCKAHDLTLENRGNGIAEDPDMNDKIAQTYPDGSVDKPDELVPQITIDDVSYSMSDFDETVEF